VQIADLNRIEGRRFPAGRWGRTFVGKGQPIEAANFCMGYVVLDPDGGQVPWHDHSQEEVYLLLDGTFEVCVGDERQVLTGMKAVYIPPGMFHQLTNVGNTPAVFVYCYAPAGNVAHWRQELDGTLPQAGREAPPLPPGAWPQCTNKP